MGEVEGIGADEFPEQGDRVGKRARICFHYDGSRIFEGTIVRDDAGEPWQVIVRLDDGRHVLGTECALLAAE